MSPPVSAMAGIATAQVADACVRLGIPVRVAPPGIRPLDVSMAARGRALPVSHHGSVDIFLEALQASVPGDVLVIDNQARTDEGCIGDLTVIEAQACGIAGVVLWGCHRDSLELIRVGLPVFSYGSCPKGPTRGDTRIPSALESAWFGEFTVTRDDFVFADTDGVLFVPAGRIEEVLESARCIAEVERRQAKDVRSGTTLRDQLRFAEYLTRRAEDPSYTFRRHLRLIGGAIEE